MEGVRVGHAAVLLHGSRIKVGSDNGASMLLFYTILKV